MGRAGLLSVVGKETAIMGVVFFFFLYVSFMWENSIWTDNLVQVKFVALKIFVYVRKQITSARLWTRLEL